MIENGIGEVYDKIYRYCYYKLGNAQLAEDMTQETFLKYFAQNTKIEKSGQMAYLYTIAKNLCIDCYRKPKLFSYESCVPEQINEAEAEGFSGALEQRTVLRQAMEKLEEGQREVLFLRYVNELSVKEIAAFMGISRFAVHRLEKAALSAMKETLSQEDFYG